jgi:hypothetical protein
MIWTHLNTPFDNDWQYLGATEGLSHLGQEDEVDLGHRQELPSIHKVASTRHLQSVGVEGQEQKKKILGLGP